MSTIKQSNIRLHDFTQILKIMAVGLVYLIMQGCATVEVESNNLIPRSKTAEFATQDPIELLVIGKRAYNSKRFDLAERALLESIKLSPSVIDSHLYLGNLYFLTNRHTSSREQYAKALQLDKSNLIAGNNTMLIDLRQAEQSLILLKSILQANNKESEYVQDLLNSIQKFLKPGKKVVNEKLESINTPTSVIKNTNNIDDNSNE